MDNECRRQSRIELMKTTERITDKYCNFCILFLINTAMYQAVLRIKVVRRDNKENVEHASKYLSSQPADEN